MPMARREKLVTFFLAGLAVGTIDSIFIIVAYVVLGRATLLRLFQGIASSLLDKASFEGGLPTALLGLCIHYSVAHAWSGLYLIADDRLAWLRRRTESLPGMLATGALYGVVIFFSMRWLVLPLTHAGSAAWLSFNFNLQLAAHALLIGPPIAAIVRARRRRGAGSSTPPAPPA